MNHKTSCAILILLIATSIFYLSGNNASAAASAPDNAWQATWGNGPWMTSEQSTANCLIQMDSGAYAMAAGYQNQVYAAKINSAGVLVWSKSYVDGKGVAIAENGDGFMVAYNGPKSGSEYLVGVLAVDGNGNMLWNRTLIYSNQYMTLKLASMVKTVDGGFVVAGSISNLDTDTLETDFLLIKIGADGSTQWKRTYGGPDFDEAASVVATADGGYAVAGFTASFGPHGTNYWLVKTDWEGNMQWSKAYGLDVAGYKSRDGLNEGGGLAYGAGDNLPSQVIQTADGGYAVFGSQGQEPNEYYPWLIKTDAYGSVQWNMTYAGGVAPWQYGYSVAQTGDGGYALACTQRENSMNGPYQTWIVKTDQNGSAQWDHNYREYQYFAKGYREPAKVTPCTIIQTKDNSLAFLGTIQDYPHTDYFTLIKTTPFLPTALPPPQNITYNPESAPKMQFPTVTIAQSGAVTPADAPISASGNTYTLNRDFQGNIVVEKDNTVLDGAGHTLYGNGTLTQSDGSQTFIQFTDAGVTLNGTSGAEVKNLRLYGFQSLIKLDGACKNIRIDDNTFSGPFGKAVYCWKGRVDGLNVVGNVFSKVDGLTLMNMQNSRISRNTFTDSKSIWANNCNQTQILYNNMFNTQISLGEQGAGNLIAANTITNSSAAISTVANSTIKYNQIINCQTAINQASNCEVTQNNIENCDTAFSYAENNVIYQNNIVGCAKLVQGQYTYHSVYPMANNTWSRDGVGNFWSSYNGSGTVFVLDENNIDSHPLTSEVKIEVPQDLDGQTLALDQTLLLVAAVAAVAVAAIVVILLAKRKRRSTQA